MPSPRALGVRIRDRARRHPASRPLRSPRRSSFAPTRPDFGSRSTTRWRRRRSRAVRIPGRRSRSTRRSRRRCSATTTRSAPGAACGYRSARRSWCRSPTTAYEAIFRFTGRRTVLGADTVGDHVSEAAPGHGEAYRMLAARSADDGPPAAVSSTRRARRPQLSLGLYADAGGTPGALLGAGFAKSVQSGAWNEVELDHQPKVTAGRSYWIGLLNPADQRGRPALARPGRRRPAAARRPRRGGDLAALPATWATGATLLRRAALGVRHGARAAARPTWPSTSSPGRLAFAATAGGAAPAPQSLVVQANNGGCGPCHWEISDDARRGSRRRQARATGRPRCRCPSTRPSLNPGIYRATVVVDRGAGIDAHRDPGRAEGRRRRRAPRRRLELRRGRRLDGDRPLRSRQRRRDRRRAAHDRSASTAARSRSTASATW